MQIIIIRFTGRDNIIAATLDLTNYLSKPIKTHSQNYQNKIHDEITWVPEEDEEEYLFLMFILHPNPPIPGQRLMVFFFLLYQLQFPLGFSICFALCFGLGKKIQARRGLDPVCISRTRIHQRAPQQPAGVVSSKDRGVIREKK